MIDYLCFVMIIVLGEYPIQDGLEGEKLCSRPVDGERGNEDVNMGEILLDCTAHPLKHLYHVLFAYQYFQYL